MIPHGDRSLKENSYLELYLSDPLVPGESSQTAAQRERGPTDSAETNPPSPPLPPPPPDVSDTPFIWVAKETVEGPQHDLVFVVLASPVDWRDY